MTQEELSQQISQLKTQVNTFENELETIKRTLTEHQHSGLDGSSKLSEETIWLKEGRALGAGHCGLAGTNRKIGDVDVYYGVFGAGPEVGYGQQTFSNQTKNSELVLEHQIGGLSLLYPFVNAISIDCSARNISVTTGQTTFSDSVLDLGADNSKAGYYLILIRKPINPSDYTDYGYQIASNTKSSLTLSSGITFSGQIDGYVISTYLYLGSSVGQFKKIYTLDGLRFGPGESYNGQNALLFMDTDGSLKYKKLNGTVVTVVAA